ncbi:hypothetical protein FLAVO9AF_340005 [Flavobacterium sp. 9AF]|nr:hypothetical protein FLAVO9AF_340005 [Flavobacterium sp. 9AF]
MDFNVNIKNQCQHQNISNFKDFLNFFNVYVPRKKPTSTSISITKAILKISQISLIRVPKKKSISKIKSFKITILTHYKNATLIYYL